MTRDHSGIEDWTWWALVVGMLGVLVLAGSGCAVSEPVPAEDRGHAHLKQATVAINAGDLASARAELDGARPHADDEPLRRQIRDLERLIDGAEALERGDVREARRHWQTIDDPHLARELRRQAEAIGLELHPRTVANEVNR